jgi:hypothetical protein
LPTLTLPNGRHPDMTSPLSGLMYSQPAEGRG